MVTLHLVPGGTLLTLTCGAVSTEGESRGECTEEVSAEVVAVTPLSATLIPDSWCHMGLLPAGSLQALWPRLFKGD